MTSTLSRPNRLSKRNSSNNYNTSVTSVSTSSGPRRSGEDFEKALQAPDDVNRFSSADSKRFGIGNTASSTSTSYRDAASMTAVNNSGGLQPAVTRNSPDPQAESNSQGRPTHVSRLSISTATSSAASSGGGVGAPDSPRRSGHRGVHGHGKDKNGGTYAIGSVGVSVGIDSEVRATEQAEHTQGKRRSRSIFRSPGTASSPDLATLMKKARDARQSETPIPAGTHHPVATQNEVSEPREVLSSPQQLSTSQSPQSQQTAISTDPCNFPSDPHPQRERAASHGAALKASTSGTSSGVSGSLADSEWSSGHRSLASGNTVIGDVRGGSGRDSSGEADEGHKSIRIRARGMLGRLFHPSREQSSPPSKTMRSQSEKHPSSAHSSHDTIRHPSGDRSLAAPPPDPLTRSRLSADTFQTALIDRRESATSVQSNQTERRSLGLPRVSIEDATVGRARNGSRHTRQPATETADEAEQVGDGVIWDNIGTDKVHGTTYSGPSQDTTPMKMNRWKRHVEGAIKGQGIERDLALEIGLPAHSLQGQVPSPSSPEGLGFPIGAETSIDSHQPDGIVNRRDRAGPKAIPNRSTSLIAGQIPDLASPQSLSSLDVPSSFRNSHDSDISIASHVPRGLHSDGSSLEVPEGPYRPNSLRRKSSSSSQRAPLGRDNDDATISAGSRTPIASRSEADHGELIGRKTDPALDKILESPQLTTPATPVPPFQIIDQPSSAVADASEEQQDIDARAWTIAQACYAGEGLEVKQDSLAEYLGSTKVLNRRVLRFYMAYFNLAGLRLDEAFRTLCQKLYLKAESQEIDRILDVFSQRYFDCNPDTIFISPSIIHIVTTSFLLLNTDLHIADISNHMSRTQFIKSTVETIAASGGRADFSERGSTPDLINNDSSSSLRASSSAAPSTVGPFVYQAGSPTLSSPSPPNLHAKSAELGAIPPPMIGTHNTMSVHTGLEPRMRLSSTATINSTSRQGKLWEADIETALRDIYQAVKAHQILLPSASNTLPNSYLTPASPSGTLGRRSSARNSSIGSGDRLGGYKRGSLRHISGLSPSLVNGDGRLSPTPSHATSINEAFDRQFLAAPALGFASNLSHSVIREDETTSDASSSSTSGTEDMDDDELALLGAPWAKEGNLQRKPYWEGPGKRSREKSWRQVFAVLQKGDLHTFTFGEGSSRSIAADASIGGGNWMTNARGQGDMNLSHALASALPPPGYNAQRPYCFSLTLHNGEMSFFQAGTEELVQEWVSTCNYWAARRSRPPLAGGVSNVDYGWRALETLDGEDHADSHSVFSNRSAKSRRSFQQPFGRRNFGSEKISISDWKAPQPSLIPSPLDEESQLESLYKHTQSLVKDLEHHKALEGPLSRFYQARSQNAIKARENWKTRSLYIHSEIVKYEVYVEALKAAIALRLKKQGERKLEKSLRRQAEVDEEDEDAQDAVQASEVRLTPIKWAR